MTTRKTCDVVVDDLLLRVKSLKDGTRLLDAQVSDMMQISAREMSVPDRCEVCGVDHGYLKDVIDHLHQVHMLLTSIKGHLGAVNYSINAVKHRDKE